MNISIPDSLQERMRPFADTVVWSAIAQKAFELEIASRSTGAMDMEAAVERLRASKEKIEMQQRPQWTESGRKWAAEDAEYDQLERVGMIPIENYLEEGSDAFLVLKEFCAAFNDDPHPDRQQLQELCEMLTGDGRKQPTLNQLAWFIDGAQAIWAEVAERI
jgi:hypothetical protein